MKDKRTLTQNRAMHKYFTQLAEALNDGGLDMKRTLKPEIDIPWSGATVKKFLWKPIQDAILDKDSTTELDTKEPSLVYETLNRHLSEKFGIHVPFPSVEEILLKNLQ